MGEYWKPVNVTRKEFVHAHRVDEGLKLVEWTWPGSAVLAIVGTWAPTDDIRVVSDYGGDIRITDAAVASTEEVTYESVEEGGYTSMTTAKGRAQHNSTLETLIKIVAHHVSYPDWREAWEELLNAPQAR